MSAYIKPGYKQTEVGVIPDDWAVEPFEEVTEIITCGLAATPTYVPESVGKPFLSAQNVHNGHVVMDNHRFIPKELFEQITRHNKPRRGDLLYTRVGAGIGEAGIVESDLEFGIYVSLTLIRTDSRRLHNGFALHLLNSTAYRARAKGGQFAGGGVQNLNVEVVREFPIPLPSSEEQRAIAKALSEVDGLLGALERLIAKKRDLKQAAMQQLLTGQTRLPGFSGDWVTASVGELERRKMLRLSRGKVISKKDIDKSPGEYPIYSSSVHDDGLFGRYGDYMFDQELITWSVDGGGNFFHRAKHRFSVTNVCGYMQVLSDEILPRFFAAQLQLLHQSKSFDYQTKAHPSVVRKEFVVSLPPLAEQTAIAAVLSEQDGELAVLEQRREKTRALKQAMMQELLAGRTRLV